MYYSEFYIIGSVFKIVLGGQYKMAEKLTLEFCKEYAEKEGYILNDGIYVNSKTDMEFIHNTLECGNKFNMKWNTFANGRRCPKCGNTKKGQSKKPAILYCKEKSLDSGYILKNNNYENSYLKMTFYHVECSTCFQMSWNDFNDGHRCPKCSIKISSILRRDKMRDRKIFSEKIGYVLLDEEWVKNSEYSIFLHKKCNRTFSMTWSNFKQGHGCPLCSNIEKDSRVAILLKKYFSINYNAILEYKECINPSTNYYLPYDIYLNLDNKKYYIEVQGEQHYKQNRKWHSNKKDFEYQMYKDKLKQDHAEKNGIFIEIDLRKRKITTEEWIQFIESHF
jgi:Zn finger protein HypA/HybF involved in hydrogenase expression